MPKQTRGILIYLAICFAGTWPYLYFARLVMDWSLVNPLVQLPVAAMPAIAAVITRKWITHEGFADAGLRLTFRGHGRHWTAALLAPLAITGLILACATALGWWTPAGSPGGIVLLLAMQIITTPIYLGEEFGWTSYLWPRLIPGRPRASVAATGLIWAIWHYPLAFLGYAEFDDHTISMILWTIMFMLFEILLCWLYARTGSVWITSLAHAGNNVVMGVLTEQLLTLDGGLTSIQVMICTDLALAAVCLPLLRSPVFRRAGRDQQPRPAATQAPSNTGISSRSS